MPYYLEYVLPGAGEVRSALDREARAQAVEAAAKLIREAGCSKAVLRWSPERMDVFGAGDIAATYTDAAGWELR
jgi:hypothetical protein